MLPGPVFLAELLTTARRPRYYLIRFVYGLVLLIFVAKTAIDRPGATALGPPPIRSYQELAELGRGLFWTFLTVQSVAVLLLTPALVAGTIADEKQRKTLHYLLASPLSGAEIVLGKLAARMLHLGVFVAVGLPVLSLLSLAGGIDPTWIALAFLATFTTAFFLSALSVLISVQARRPREAITQVYLLEVVWLFLPAIVTFAMPSAGPFWSKVYDWVRPVNEWINVTSPLYVLLANLRGLGTSRIYQAAAWMLGLQTAYGSVFVLVALWRLRPSGRDAGSQAAGGARLGRLSRKGRILRRPPCGPDAMLWKERFGSRTSVGTKAVSLGMALATTCVLADVTYENFARAAFLELFQYGYGTGVHQARDEFNGFLRAVSTVIYVVWVLGVASAASGGLTAEREEDTWTSLVATPLDGLEIVRAKMLGAFWGLRWAGFLLLVLWLTGLASGAIHPFGFAAVVLETAVFLGFAVALGTYVSLRSSTSTRALVTTIAILLIANGGYLMCCTSLVADWPYVTLGVTPMVEALSLASYDDIARLFVQADFRPRALRTDQNFVLTAFMSVLAYAASAAVLFHLAVSRFDESVDRPRRLGPAIRRSPAAIDDELGEGEAKPGRKAPSP